MSDELKNNTQEGVDNAEKVVNPNVAETPVEPEEIDLTKVRDEKCEPAAAQLLQILANYKIDFKAKNHDELMAVYHPIFKDAMSLFLEHDLTIVEINYVMRIFKSAFDSFDTIVVKSMQDLMDDARNKLFGVKYGSEITLKKLDEVLQSK